MLQKPAAPLPPTLAEIRAAGLERCIVDRSTHPGFYVSSWPMGFGHTTLEAKTRYRLPHLNHNSVLVTVASNEWCEGGWWRLQNMLRYAQDRGYTVALEELDDMSQMPTDAIGIMRACGAMLALDSGFEWCLMVDTDVLLAEDTLVKLLSHDRPVVFPYLDILQDKYRWAPISAPRLRPSMGLQPVTWAAMSVMLFNTKVFNCLDHYAWHGHDLHFSQSLVHYGHRVYVDTDTVVQVTRGPSRHPSKQWGEFWTDSEEAYNRRQNQDRDRRPPPDWDPAFGQGVVDKDGVYWAVDSWKYGGALQTQPYMKNGMNGDSSHAEETAKT